MVVQEALVQNETRTAIDWAQILITQLEKNRSQCVQKCSNKFGEWGTVQNFAASYRYVLRIRQGEAVLLLGKFGLMFVCQSFATNKHLSWVGCIRAKRSFESIRVHFFSVVILLILDQNSIFPSIYWYTGWSFMFSGICAVGVTQALEKLWRITFDHLRGALVFVRTSRMVILIARRLLGWDVVWLNWKGGTFV